MKKNIFILVVCLFVSGFAFAQDNVSYGVKAGINYSNLINEFEDSNNNFLDFNSKIGFYVGGFINLSLSDKISLQPELLYSSQGAKLDVDFSQLLIIDEGDGVFLENRNDVNVKQSKLLVPILLEYKATNAVSLFLGPQITYLFNFENELEGGDEVMIARFGDEDKIGVDLAGRLGYQVSDEISFELGYFRGLTNQNSVKSSVFQLGLAYRL